MNGKPGKEPDTFFWIKSGEVNSVRKQKSIHIIQRPEVDPATPSPKRTLKDPKRAGLKSGWIRATFIVREEKLSRLKALAYWERKEIKEIVDEAITEYLADKEIKPAKDNKGP